MRMSQLFTKTSKNVPADETSKNAQLLIQAGFVYKVMAGVYAYTPLGLKVLENIKTIVREEMDAVGGQELIMSNLQPKETWEATGRWSSEAVDVWFKTELQDGTELGLAWSHEEAIMEMMRQYIQSYKDLPVSVYQFQTKLRNELRAKAGIMRGREFVMKDMYSLHATEEDMDAYYEKVIEAYKRIYDRLGIGSDTYITFASGGAFTKFSHEFQTICEAGEDVLYLHDASGKAVNEEVLDEAARELGVEVSEMHPVKAAESGNIFKFGTEKSDKMNIHYVDADGQLKPIYLASYGIGITRAMGVIVEKFSDERGLVWPEAVAPAKVYLARITKPDDTSDVSDIADKIYEELTRANIGVLYDDREVRAGQKFADADLLGIPYRVVISDKTVASDAFEVKARTAQDPEFLTRQELMQKLGVAL